MAAKKTDLKISPLLTLRVPKSLEESRELERAFKGQKPNENQAFLALWSLGQFFRDSHYSSV